MQTQLQPGETMIREAAANLQRGLETVGGRLCLTTQRLVFESHGFNVQTGVTAVPLKQVRDARKCWTKFLGFLPLLPNSIAVTLADGTELRIVIFRRAEWIEAIMTAAEPLRNP